MAGAHAPGLTRAPPDGVPVDWARGGPCYDLGDAGTRCTAVIA
jgi:hypothetical protein